MSGSESTGDQVDMDATTSNTVTCDNCDDVINKLHDTYVSVEFMDGMKRQRGWFFCDDTCFLANYND